MQAKPPSGRRARMSARRPFGSDTSCSAAQARLPHRRAAPRRTMRAISGKLLSIAILYNRRAPAAIAGRATVGSRWLSPWMVATRFAVATHILLYLATEGSRGASTSLRLAWSVNTNPVVVRRIAGQLARAGLIRVRRGPGGAELAREPERITLED